MNELVWAKSVNGWGLTEYRATGAKGRYLVKKSGGRHFNWEVLRNGERLSGASTMRAAKSIAATRD